MTARWATDQYSHCLLEGFKCSLNGRFAYHKKDMNYRDGNMLGMAGKFDTFLENKLKAQ